MGESGVKEFRGLFFSLHFFFTGARRKAAWKTYDEGKIFKITFQQNAWAECTWDKLAKNACQFRGTKDLKKRWFVSTCSYFVVLSLRVEAYPELPKTFAIHEIEQVKFIETRRNERGEYKISRSISPFRNGLHEARQNVHPSRSYHSVFHPQEAEKETRLFIRTPNALPRCPDRWLPDHLALGITSFVEVTSSKRLR